MSAEHESLLAGEWLTINEVANYLRMSRATVVAAVKSGQLPSRVFAGRLIRIPRAVFVNALREAEAERCDVSRLLRGRERETHCGAQPGAQSEVRGEER
jgi:excisionase family DNA binding protein